MEVLTSLVIRALNHLIRGESWAQARLVGHSGAQVAIDSGLFALRLGIDAEGLFRAGDKALDPDVSISLPPDIPVRLLFDQGTLFSSVKLEGSADIAESLAFVLRNLRWDAESDLAQLIGDIPARRLVRLAQTMAMALQDAVGRVAENFAEYAVEESGMLAAKRDISEFGDAVNCLRDDVERFEKRLTRL
jgi:ubiquinone biosynthesis protein UbiJ